MLDDEYMPLPIQLLTILICCIIVSNIIKNSFLQRYFKLVFLVTLTFQFEFETMNQPGFEPGTSGPQAATLTIELHSK